MVSRGGSNFLFQQTGCILLFVFILVSLTPWFPFKQKLPLLRIANAALNDEPFFVVAGHNMTVVEIDAVYTKPFTTSVILIAPGQTTNVLVYANRAPGRYFMVVRPFQDVPIPVDNKTATAILQYKGIPQKETLSVFPQEVGLQFGLELIIHEFGFFIVI